MKEKIENNSNKAIEELKEFINNDEVQNISVFTAKKILSELKKQTNIARKEHNEHMEKKRQLETQINNTHILQSQLDVANAEKIEWKKIAEKLADELRLTININKVCGTLDVEKKRCHKENISCKQCAIDWARKEVENQNGKI